MNIVDTLQNIQSGHTLTEQDMTQVMASIMSGEWSDEQITAFLVELAKRGETIEEITGAAKVMREKALPINAPANSVDCCGTGGDKSGTYNISTAVAIVAAACGVTIAKHGNRSSSSKSGAADVLEALGVNLDVSQESLEEALRLYNFAFLMAPRHHEAMKYVMPARKTLKSRTIFNILGPLANPAQTQFQLLGVFDRQLVLPIANVLKNMGTNTAWVVHGSDGLDEITTTGETYVAKLKEGKITEETLMPRDFGLPTANPQDLIGGEPEHNATALREILNGKHNAYRNIVVANTAAVLMISGKEDDLIQASKRAAFALDNGSACTLLDRYIAFTHKYGEQ